MKKLLLLPFILSCFSVSAQTFLNGDFEINSAVSCQFNLPNTSFNSYISNTIAFGGASEMDIQTAPCGYAAPSNGAWFVSLATSIIGNADAISMELSAPLVAGNAYTFTYDEYADTTFSPRDSLEIGLSGTSGSFGTLLYTSRPLVNVWTQRTVTFVAPVSGAFITLRNQGVSRGWNFIDHFSFGDCAPVTLGPDVSVCAGETVLLNPSVQPGSAFLWQNGSTGSSYTVTAQGAYWVEVTKGLCTVSDSIFITYNALPVVNLGNDRSICLSDSLVLTAGNPGASYVWQNGSTAQTMPVTAPGIYSVEVTKNNCTTLDAIEIDTISCGIPVLQMPNVFSPNGDGDNDDFVPVQFSGLDHTTLTIYNRWGQKLFETADPERGWNGKSNSSDCTAGVYYWIVNYTESGSSTQKVKTGFVALLR